MGDFNFNLLRYQDHVPTQEFLDCLYSYSLYPLITKPTRITSHTSTLIANIFTNVNSQNKTNGIIINDISDHLPIFSINCDISLPNRGRAAIFIRDYNDKNIQGFRESLLNVNWDDLNSIKDVNEAYDCFLDKYSRLYNSHFPVKEISGKALKTFQSPWITKGLLKSIKKKSFV